MLHRASAAPVGDAAAGRRAPLRPARGAPGRPDRFRRAAPRRPPADRAAARRGARRLAHRRPRGGAPAEVARPGALAPGLGRLCHGGAAGRGVHASTSRDRFDRRSCACAKCGARSRRETAALAAERARPRPRSPRCARRCARSTAAPPKARDGVEEDLAFHRLLAEAAGNPQFGRLLEFLEQYTEGSDARDARRNEASRADFIEAVRVEHARDRRGDRRRDPPRSRAAAPSSTCAAATAACAPPSRSRRPSATRKSPDPGARTAR